MGGGVVDSIGMLNHDGNEATFLVVYEIRMMVGYFDDMMFDCM